MKKFLSVFLIMALTLTFAIGCSKSNNESNGSNRDSSGNEITTINAKTLADISVDGLNTRGTISVDVDNQSVAVFYASFADEHDLQINLTLEKALRSLRFETDESSSATLSNGDEVLITTYCDEFMLKEANVIFENLEFTYIVSGLKDGILLDPFEEIEIEFSGVSPRITAQVFNRSEKQFVRDIVFSVDPYHSLKIGDKVDVSILSGIMTLPDKGYILPDVLTKEYVVENVDAYIYEVDNSVIEATQKESIDTAVAYCAKEYGGMLWAPNFRPVAGFSYDNTSFDEPEITNIYFLKLKPGAGESYYAYNFIIYIFKVTAHDLKYSKTQEGYMAVQSHDLIRKINGDLELSDSSTVVYANLYFDSVYNDALLSRQQDYDITEIPF